MPQSEMRHTRLPAQGCSFYYLLGEQLGNRSPAMAADGLVHMLYVAVTGLAGTTGVLSFEIEAGDVELNGKPFAHPGPVGLILNTLTHAQSDCILTR